MNLNFFIFFLVLGIPREKAFLELSTLEENEILTLLKPYNLILLVLKSAFILHFFLRLK